VRWLVALALMLILATPPTGALAQTFVPFTAGWFTVLNVVDGDTVWVEQIDRSIRLAGINAPESYEDCGEDATLLVQYLAGARSPVYVEPAEIPFDVGTNRYRAYLRITVENDTVTLQELLLEHGLARMDRSGRFVTQRYYEWFDRAERQARAQGLGIWGAGCGGNGANPGDGHRAAPLGWDCPDGYPIKGNAQSMIYHLPGGRFYGRTRPEDCFATENDAVMAGYRRSRV